MKEQKIYLNYLKAFAAILVIIFHSTIYYQDFTGIARNGFENYIYILTSFTHVPLFFLISGYLSHKQPLKGYYTKKLLRIIVPFYFFNVIKILILLFSIPNLTWNFVGYQLYYHFILGESYWFCYAITIIYLIAPLFWFFGSKKWPILEILLVVLIAFNGVREILNWPTTTVFQLDRVFYHLPYYIIGYLIATKYKDKINIVNWWTAIIGLLLALAYPLCIKYDNSINLFTYKLIPSFGSFIFLWFVSKKLPQNWTFLSNIGRHSYQLYLVDAFVLLAVLLMTKLSFNQAIMLGLISVIVDEIVCEIIEYIPVASYLFGLSYKKTLFRKA